MAGRFISPDPAVPDLSSSKNPWNFDPRMLNRYAYCRNNPLIYVDPTGLAMTEANAGDDEGQDSEGPSDGSSGSGENGDGTEAGQNGKNAPQNDPGDEEEGDSPGKNRKSGKTTVVSWQDLDIDNPLDNPQGQVIEDKNGNRTYVNPHGPNQNLGKKNWAAVVDLSIGITIMAFGVYMKNGYLLNVGIKMIAFSAPLVAIDFGFKGDTSKIPPGGVLNWGVVTGITKGIVGLPSAP